jgi:uncharacterized SAM-binding protein YcdF (DUF218 family)
VARVPSGRESEDSSSAALSVFSSGSSRRLDFTTLISFHGDRTLVVLALAVAGALLGLARFDKLLVFATAAGLSLWLLVALTPLTEWMGEDLVRRDPPQKADAVFVLASGLQQDGELSSVAMSRLLGGLELLGEGFAPRLVLSELPLPYPRYRQAAGDLMSSLGMSHEILVVGPVLNTHEEAVAVGALARAAGFERLLVVTSPSHSLRASLALEAEGVNVISVPSVETTFDYENLGAEVHGDDRVRAFGALIHERVGLLYYRYKGWIR